MSEESRSPRWHMSLRKDVDQPIIDYFDNRKVYPRERSREIRRLVYGGMRFDQLEECGLIRLLEQSGVISFDDDGRLQYNPTLLTGLAVPPVINQYVMPSAAPVKPQIDRETVPPQTKKDRLNKKLDNLI